MIENWWHGKVDWSTPSGQLLQRFFARLPKDRSFHFTIYGSAPLQLTLDSTFISGDVDLFSDDDFDLSEIIASANLDKSHVTPFIEAGYELSFRTTSRWRRRAVTVQLENVSVTIPHPIDILIGKLDRLDPKDLLAFRRVITLTGHPTAIELLEELQNAVDLFRPSFDETSPNRYPENTRRLWREIFQLEIDIRKEIIEPALKLRARSYGEDRLDYKKDLGR